MFINLCGIAFCVLCGNGMCLYGNEKCHVIHHGFCVTAPVASMRGEGQWVHSLDYFSCGIFIIDATIYIMLLYL